MDYTKKNGVLVPKQRLFAPMLSTFGGGSARGFNPGGVPILFTQFTFTNCGATGTEGPSLTDCRTAYSPTEWDDTDTTQFNVTTNGYQDFKIIQSGTYRLRVRGARGGHNTRLGSGNGTGGQGAEIDVNFTFSAGDALRIIVGQHGVTETSGGSGGGGGGSFVLYGSSMTAFANTDTYITNNLLVAAGGGGGGTDHTDDAPSLNNGMDGVANSLSGTNSRGGSTTGGSGGDGGVTGSGDWAGAGGAGITGNGSQPRNSGNLTGSAPVDYSGGFGGGAGGVDYGEDGGFGGGAGGSWGGSGGGGYSGGGGDDSTGSGSDKEGGGGGGSYKDTQFSGYSLNTQGNHSDDNGSVLLQLV